MKLTIGALYRTAASSGYLVALATDRDGRELAVLETAPHRWLTVLASTLTPVDEALMAFELRLEMIGLSARARFLRVGDDMLLALFAAQVEGGE